MNATTLRPEIAALVIEGVATILTFPREPRLDAGSRLLIHAGAKGSSEWCRDHPHAVGLSYGFYPGGGYANLHFSAILGSVRVDAGVPIEDLFESINLDDPSLDHGHVLYVCSEGMEPRILDEVYRHEVPTRQFDRADQLPFADFTSGRWAVLVSDPRKTTDQCPMCLSGSGTSIDEYGEAIFLDCPVCSAQGRCPPIPYRKGRAGIWTWTP